MAGSSLGPSTPQFQLWLSSMPSRLCSPLASLCLCSYDTRSRSVKPSWAVMKLTLAGGRRPWFGKMSLEPVRREASVATWPASPRQKRRTVSRNGRSTRPSRGKAAQPVAVRTQIPRLGDQLDAGQHRILANGVEKAAARIEAAIRASRASVVARSKRKPSTPICCTQ